MVRRHFLGGTDSYDNREAVASTAAITRCVPDGVMVAQGILVPFV